MGGDYLGRKRRSPAMGSRYIPAEMAVVERFWHSGRHNPVPLRPAETFPRQSGPCVRAAPKAELERELLVGA